MIIKFEQKRQIIKGLQQNISQNRKLRKIVDNILHQCFAAKKKIKNYINHVKQLTKPFNHLII